MNGGMIFAPGVRKLKAHNESKRIVPVSSVDRVDPVRANVRWQTTINVYLSDCERVSNTTETRRIILMDVPLKC